MEYKVSFGAGRIKEYTPIQRKIMKEMKKAAISNNWHDIYTGKTFSKYFMPTIEHVIPHSQKDTFEIKELSKKGFEIDGLDNIFPVGSLGNSSRGSQSFVKSIIEEPKILTRLLNELNKYKDLKTEHINGKCWVKRLQNTLAKELTGLCSDIKSRKLKIEK